MPSHGVGDDPWVEVVWAPTRRDMRRSIAVALRSRIFTVAAGVVLIIGAVWTVRATTETDEGFLVPTLVPQAAAFLAASLATAPHAAGLLLWYLHPLVQATETLRVDSRGVTSTTPRTTCTILWQEIRRVREIDGLVVLVARQGRLTLVTPIPMRVLPSEERTTVRTLITAQGLRIG